MDLQDRTVLVLGGAGLVGISVCRRILEFRPRRLVVASLRLNEAEEAVEELGSEPGAEAVTLDAVGGDIFVPRSLSERDREGVMVDPEARVRLVDDLYGELTDEVLERSALGSLLLGIEPDVVVDCVNTAGALAYQDVFRSVAELRKQAAEDGRVPVEAVERHLCTLYLPQLIRHVQISLEGMKRAGTGIYVKIGTSGTGGMGLNVPFTHSEERPSRMLLSKSGLAGAHTLLLYLMARTPDAPAVKEIKPTAAISWKSIGYGPIERDGRPIHLVDATEPLPLDEAFGSAPERGYEELDEPLEGVYLDAGENGLFSLPEFETLTALGLMEFVTPEEIADAVIREIRGHPTGRDVVAALDASTMGPTYRAGALRSVALRRMEGLEQEREEEAVAYEMLGPPRLSKLLFEAAILGRVFRHMDEAAALDPVETADRARALVESDSDLRRRILSIGLPILLPDGGSVLRGSQVKVPPDDPGTPLDPRIVDRGWVDLRPENWARWADRLRALRDEIGVRPPVEEGSRGDHEHGDREGSLRPGRLAAWIFRTEDEGERIKR